MKQAQQNDAILALISTLTVVFIVLFISLAYFLNYRGTVARQEARAEQLLRELNTTAQQAPVYGDVAGYQISE